MKKVLCLAAVILTLSGCTMENAELDQALAFRSRLLGAAAVTFDAQITADYSDHVEQFTLRCETDEAGALRFTVLHPAEISGITGTVAGQQGSLSFDDTILAFPLMAQERLSPVSGPWVLMQALRSGYITSCGQEGDLLHLSVNDSYCEDPLTLEIWLSGERVTSAEIGWRGMRQMTLLIENFTIL